ncbi:hypothetical protein GCM10023264_11850 [Sphingomonas daechungensis]
MGRRSRRGVQLVERCAVAVGQELLVFVNGHVGSPGRSPGAKLATAMATLPWPPPPHPMETSHPAKAALANALMRALQAGPRRTGMRGQLGPPRSKSLFTLLRWRLFETHATAVASLFFFKI